MKFIRSIGLSVAVACGALGALAAQHQELTLAARGAAAAYTIVLPKAASPSQRYAAEELQRYTARMTGVMLPIITDDQPLPAKRVQIVTRTDKTLGEDGFQLKVQGEALTIAGSSVRGALYGVYELLERFGGCRWYASWCEKIPVRDAFKVCANLDDTQTPAFEMRLPFWYDVITHTEYASRIRCNCTWRPIEPKFGGDSYRFGGGLGCCHTFDRLVPLEKYGKTHPEYYAFRNGARRVNPPPGGRQWYLQLCLTNPDVLKIVVEGVKERIRKDPGARFYGVSQNDNWNYCQCPKCAAVDAEEGSHAGTVVRFVNAVAAEVEKEFPGVLIETLAYQFSRQPPKKTRLRPNVIPCLCSIECDFARPIPESPYPQNIKFCTDIKGWTSQTDMLYVWDYTTNFRHYTYPLSNVYALQGNIKFFRDHKVKCLFEQGAQLGRHGAFGELKAWLLAKWMWNPDLPIKPLLDDFFAGYYGKGAPFVRDYFEEEHRIHRAYSADPKRPSGIYEDVMCPAFSDAFLEKAAGLWAQAIAATKDDPIANYNVRMGAFGTDYTRLERMRRRLVAPDYSFVPNWKPAAKWTDAQALARSLIARMEEAKDICLSESRQNAVTNEWNALFAQTPTVPKLVEGNRLVLGVNDLIQSRRPSPTYTALVEDPAAKGGKAIKLLNTHYEWCVTYSMSKVVFVPGVKYRVRAHLRVEPKAGKTGEAFWSGVYDGARNQGKGGCRPKVTEVKPGYQWYDIATITPERSDYFWIGPGFYNTKAGETTSIEGVWIDQLEITPVAGK